MCAVCEHLSMKIKDPCLNDSAKRVATTEMLVHKRRAKRFYSKLQKFAKNNEDDTVVLAFDYMQNLPAPEILLKVRRFFTLGNFAFTYSVSTLLKLIRLYVIVTTRGKVTSHSMKSAPVYWIIL